MTEVWRPVPEWPYEASNLGQLRSSRTGSILRPTITHNGYEKVTFQANLARRDVRVHRMVFEAWTGPIQDGLVINHLNGDKRDNRPENLEACTARENTRHAARMGLMASGDRNGVRTKAETRVRGSQHQNTTLSENDIPVIREMSAHGVTQTQIALRFGVSKSAIHLILKGKTWTHV